MKRIIKFSNEAQNALKIGIDKLTDAVKCTLGPQGRQVVLDIANEPLSISDDGVTVAKHVVFDDVIENTGAKFLIEAASKTNEVAGDGTTTAIILAHSIITEGLRQISNGISPIFIKQGLESVTDLIISNLNKLAKPISTSTEIQNIANISSGNEKIGKIIAEGIKKIGKFGILTVDDSPSDELKVEIADGMQFNKGFISPYMANIPQRGASELHNPDILITDLKITTIDEILPLLQKLHQYNKKNLVIFADSIEGEALSLLVINKLKGVFEAVAVQAPGFGANKKDYLNDIAVVTGGTLITKEAGQRLDDVSLEQLGKARKTIINKDKTIIIGGRGSKQDILKYQESLKSLLEKTKNPNEKERLQDRIANLTGKIGVIKINAATESEAKAKKFKIEDAINATKAAIDEGIVIGGGIALLQAINKIDPKNLNESEKVAFQILKKAIEQPIKQIARNAGFNGDVVLKTINDSNDPNFGFNAKTLSYENLTENGVIDPVKVVRIAIKNAVSISSLFLTTEVAIADIIENPKNLQ